MTPHAIVVLSFVAGALHRRMFGGWLGIRGLFLRPSPVIWAIPSWLTFPGPYALVITVLVMLHYNLAHRFDRPLHVLVRYGIAPVILAVITTWWPALLVGPAVAFLAWLCRTLNLPAVRMPWEKPDDPHPLLDGWEAWWELGLGGLSAAAWVSAGLMGLPIKL